MQKIAQGGAPFASAKETLLSTFLYVKPIAYNSLNFKFLVP